MSSACSSEIPLLSLHRNDASSLCLSPQVGLALAYSLPVVSLLNGLLTAFADTEKDMVAVERVGQARGLYLLLMGFISTL